MINYSTLKGNLQGLNNNKSEANLNSLRSNILVFNRKSGDSLKLVKNADGSFFLSA